ncbi:MAG: hypothetical protein WCF12_09975 [Propionicimonas sp.]
MSRPICGATRTDPDHTVLSCTVVAGHDGKHQCYLGDTLHEWGKEES